MPISPRPRHASIDFLKAAAILCVVWIHAYLTLWRPQVGLVRFLGALTRFAVPAFLFASGFLAHRLEPIGAAVLAQRLRRLIVPYLVASLIAVAVRWLAVGPIPPSRVGWELLTGDAVGIYYFMLPLVVATFLIVPLSRHPGSVAPLLAVLFLAAWLCECRVLVIPAAVPFEYLFWNQRNPLRWLVYFAGGWFCARHADAIGAMTSGQRAGAGLALLSTGVAVSGAFVWTAPGPLASTLEYLTIWTLTLGILLLAHDRSTPPAVRWLSDASYPIYLYHFFFIAAFRFLWRDQLLARPGMTNLAVDSASFALGLGGSVAIVWLGRRLLGRHARALLG